ncbi:MAG TPA: hypothetical protein VM553_17735 [Dongiaceae bacterium]|nr:hypothetical protein [Dongiaceae bacterium]
MAGIDSLKSLRAISWLSLLTSSGTLVCCALPALLVALGAGAALSTMIATVPQLVWFSDHKEAVFGTAGIMLAVAGVMQWHSRSLPCPAEQALAQACQQLRRRSLVIYLLSVTLFAIGGFFAFVATYWL